MKAFTIPPNGEMNIMNKIKRMLIGWVILLVMGSAGGLLCMSGQDAVKTIKSAKITTNWPTPKVSMKYDTIEWDWSDEEPMVEELSRVDFLRLLINTFERI
jgi:hypothetical protein